MVYDTTDRRWLITEQQQISEVRFIADGKLFCVEKNGKYGLYDISSSSFLLNPIYSSISKIAGDYYLLQNGNKSSIYNMEKRAIMGSTIRIDMEYVSLKGGPGLDYQDVTIIQPGVEEVTMDITVYHKNGKVLRNRGGYIVGTEIQFPLTDGIRFGGRDRILFEYSNFPYGKNDFYILVKFKDEKGKVLPYKGKTKFPFYVTRR